ncbi:protein PATRONUS 2-like isoform X2 [Salvia splendens]|uniref:protein PATRONUS 2-like isoform X2 n=1 Tax=Salvia splendens TaxID=180675 RepID=UPI001C25B43D|nr:protein PATRONUS 2-like isoform X2 [Salvia splendens]
MATPAHRLIQDQNLNFLYSTTPGGKTDVTKADKRGGLGGRRALNDISNSRNPSSFHSKKKDSSINVISIDKHPSTVKGESSKAAEKGRVGGRKALSDLTNSVKPRPKQIPSLGRKLNAVAEEAKDGFLHNHQGCIKAQTMSVDKDYFLKTVGLANDIAALPSARKALPLSSKKGYVKHPTMEELLELPSCLSPACRSPQSLKGPYTMYREDDYFTDLMMIETPKLKYSGF